MNVAIVDDTQINLALMGALVGRIHDCRPVTFDDAHRGLDWCLENDPDLVIVDYMMPELDGLEFIEQFRRVRDGARTPVLMVTADHEKEVRYRALENGATDFLTKPVDRIEFTSRVKNMLSLRRSHLQLSIHAAYLGDEVKKATAKILARERETVLRLSRAAEFRDPETGAHILRMANYSRLIARNLGMSKAEQEAILEAAPMHDIGKLGTPDSILLKPGKLTEDEFDVMKRHAIIGHEILKDSTSPVLQLGAVVALSHHEKWDGSGYPNGLKGEDIPLVGRIVAVADVFDALTSERPYKTAWDVERSVGFLRQGAGVHFDPRSVDAFIGALDQVLLVKERYKDDDSAAGTPHEGLFCGTLY